MTTNSWLYEARSKQIKRGFLISLFLVKTFNPGFALAEPTIINPGDNIQKAVNRKPEGITFIIKAGIHRLQQVKPKNGNTFLGEPGAIMSGARLLTSFSKESRYWVASGQTQQGQAHGSCQRNADGSRYHGCKFPEDLFIDDVPLWQVTSLSEVDPGKWYFDYAADKIYLGDDPTGHSVETSVTRHAFHGSARRVTIRGLIIEKYAVPAQHGAIHGEDGTGGRLGKDWVVEGNEIRFNHGVGIRTGHRMQVLRNNIHHNGQLGIGGTGDDVLVEGNEIAYNNFAGFSSGWEAGGSKWVKTRSLVIRSNHVHHNKGQGLWTDGDNIDTLYEFNLVINNVNEGIKHEISYNAIIRNNVVKWNGLGDDVWLWGSQILIQNSRNVEVYNNEVVVSAEGGDGIGIIHQNRGGGSYGPHISVDNYIHHNTITYFGNFGQTGAAADCKMCPAPYDIESMFNGNNLFDYNTYRAPRLDWSRWEWRGTKNWKGFKAEGQEPHGSADTDLPLVMPARPKVVDR